MADTDQIAGLQSALLERADALAAQYRANAREEHDRLLAEANDRLRLAEERDAAAARAQAERVYQQRVQAATLELRAELDRLRLEQVSTVLARLPARPEALAADKTRYLPLLFAWLREGAQAIETVNLVARVNARDLKRIKAEWARHAREAAPGKQIALSPEPLSCAGGVLVSSTDGNIRVDNTFEGRMERMGERLQHTIADQLMPAGAGGG